MRIKIIIFLLFLFFLIFTTDYLYSKKIENHITQIPFSKLKFKLDYFTKQANFEIIHIKKLYPHFTNNPYYFIKIQKWPKRGDEPPISYLLACDRNFNIVQTIELGDYAGEMLFSDIDGDGIEDVVVTGSMGVVGRYIDVYLNRFEKEGKLKSIFRAGGYKHVNFYHPFDSSATIEICTYPSEEFSAESSKKKDYSALPLLIFIWNGERFIFSKEKSIGFEEDFKVGYEVEKGI